MISAGEFRNGVTFEQDGQVLQVVEFQHVKPGKGAAFVRTKTKNVITGAVIETSYNPTAKFPQAFIERRDVTYSYQDGDLYHFMDNETYDDIPVNASDVPDNFKFCKENEVCKLLSYKGKVFSVEIPNFIELTVTETEPGIRGNTATNTLKPATVETGATLRVPLFINEGDVSALIPAPASIWSASDSDPKPGLRPKTAGPAFLFTGRPGKTAGCPWMEG